MTTVTPTPLSMRQVLLCGAAIVTQATWTLPQTTFIDQHLGDAKAPVFPGIGGLLAFNHHRHGAKHGAIGSGLHSSGSLARAAATPPCQVTAHASACAPCTAHGARRTAHQIGSFSSINSGPTLIATGFSLPPNLLVGPWRPPPPCCHWRAHPRPPQWRKPSTHPKPVVATSSPPMCSTTTGPPRSDPL